MQTQQDYVLFCFCFKNLQEEIHYLTLMEVEGGSTLQCRMPMKRALIFGLLGDWIPVFKSIFRGM